MVFVRIVAFAAKAIALTVALTLWFFLGFLVWVRVVLIGFVLFTMQVTLAPFSGRARTEATRNFEDALRLWPSGFETIFRTLWAGQTTEADANAVPPLPGEEPGLLSQMLGFVWQTALAAIFWAPVILFLHFAGVWKIGALSDLEARLAPGFGPSVTEQRAARGEADCAERGKLVAVTPPQGFSTTGEVNVRQGPGTGYPKLGRLAAGETVSVIGETRNADWRLVTVDGVVRCYVSSDYLRRKR
jgi:hypothetical protein